MSETPQEVSHPVKTRFQLGMIVATPGALAALDEAATNAEDLLIRHMSWDWGEIPPEDAEQNIYAVTHGLRIMSCYPLGTEVRIWIITEADRSATTLLLPEEY